MGYTYEHIEDGDFCMVYVSGKHRRPDDSRALHGFIRDFRTRSGCSRFLVDMSKATIIGTAFDVFRAGVSPKEQGLIPSDLKIALVYSGDMAKHRFMETVLVNRGYNLKVFDNMKEAHAWMIQKDKRSDPSKEADEKDPV